MTIDTNNLIQALFNDTRLRCLVLLQLQGELCVCELTHALDQPMISRHLVLLRKAGLVYDHRAGQWIYYCINPKLPEWAKTVLETTVQANQLVSPFSEDLKILADMPNRPGSACCA